MRTGQNSFLYSFHACSSSSFFLTSKKKPSLFTLSVSSILSHFSLQASSPFLPTSLPPVSNPPIPAATGAAATAAAAAAATTASGGIGRFLIFLFLLRRCHLHHKLLSLSFPSAFVLSLSSLSLSLSLSPLYPRARVYNFFSSANAFKQFHAGRVGFISGKITT